MTSGAKTYLDDLESVGGPPPQAVRTRTTIDLHSQEVIAIHSYEDGSPPREVDLTAFESDSVDTLTYVYYSPQVAADLGWSWTPTGTAVHSSSTLSSTVSTIQVCGSDL